MSFIYLHSEPELWTVGHYRPDGGWEPESDHGSEEAAAARTALLNGDRSYETVASADSQVEALRREVADLRGQVDRLWQHVQSVSSAV